MTPEDSWVARWQRIGMSIVVSTHTTLVSKLGYDKHPD